ncbi:MAG: tryptophan synthase alpha chain [Desulfovibrionales bacterium]|jgi:tryptophan synthase alpha chain|nr:tryptophan synthase alpha chain [Desulfovibrionales bacterium]
MSAAMIESGLEAAIRAAAKEGRLALVPFLPAGYPDKDRFFEELDQLDQGGADIIEIGVPFSDPVADGPVVEEASLHCLELGVNLGWIFDELAKRKGRYKAPLVLMGYMNPFYQYGFDKIADRAKEAGVAGLVVPDLPLEESFDVRKTLAAGGVDLVSLVGLNTSAERLAEYAAVSSGFVYFVSVLGVTGVRNALPDEMLEHLKMAKQAFDVPLALGFGLKSPEQLVPLKGLVDAAVFGSALIRHIKDGGDSASFMARWK